MYFVPPCLCVSGLVCACREVFECKTWIACFGVCRLQGWPLKFGDVAGWSGLGLKFGIGVQSLRKKFRCFLTRSIPSFLFSHSKVLFKYMDKQIYNIVDAFSNVPR